MGGPHHQGRVVKGGLIIVPEIRWRAICPWTRSYLIIYTYF